ncbi:methanethiol S-methyltransferase [Urbifossiella limnaea]|uniref:methanethiol S-methyltransferase n=1 Tax=Urbifossiella limnaea TaxID=2528023 RepID=A0A517XZC0_9BACT|nr:methanethiol S-methyltransferase [Urbifossiella limnaea]QDU22862.1 Isoprenylcysteine carboxyl methyltransferase (ICMT) family protein [Urbifossiella limnaea]
MLLRVLVLAYGVAGYALFLATFVYAIGFVGGFLTPTRLDGPREGSLLAAVAIDVGLLAVFAVQHSGMARPAFKRWLTRYVPEAAERATYCVLSCAALLLMFALWRPLGGVVWDTDGAARVAVYAAFSAGWLIVLWTTFLIDHFDLFGLRQVVLFARGRPYPPARFVTPGPYRWVRHPLYVGWLTVFWAAPTMTAAHLLFAAGTTAYILIALVLEERDLTAAHPEYEAYRARVPMLVPRLRRARPLIETRRTEVTP